ncbi:MAG: hypothetical protein O6939_09115, partial [Bacteroidetes bacterium]|nr:hypothetical protein [Bacteroidota bacterium]
MPSIKAGMFTTGFTIARFLMYLKMILIFRPYWKSSIERMRKSQKWCWRGIFTGRSPGSSSAK